MGASPFFHSDLFALGVLPVLIFLARICDVSIGTIRIIFVARGLRYLAPILGFFEVLIWLLAISQVMQNLNHPVNYIAYGLGFATGNYVGIYLESRLAIGHLIVRIITRREATGLVDFLRQAGYGVTALDAEGESGRVKLIFTVASRRDLPHIIGIIKRFNPRAFYTVEDVRFVSEPLAGPMTKKQLQFLPFLRKGK